MEDAHVFLLGSNDLQTQSCSDSQSYWAGVAESERVCSGSANATNQDDDGRCDLIICVHSPIATDG
jgi:hypothetical protein